jgi:hypothetical protein
MMRALTVCKGGEETQIRPQAEFQAEGGAVEQLTEMLSAGSTGQALEIARRTLAAHAVTCYSWLGPDGCTTGPVEFMDMASRHVAPASAIVRRSMLSPHMAWVSLTVHPLCIDGELLPVDAELLLVTDDEGLVSHLEVVIDQDAFLMYSACTGRWEGAPPASDDGDGGYGDGDGGGGYGDDEVVDDDGLIPEDDDSYGDGEDGDDDEMDGLVDGWIDGQVDGMDGQADGWMDGQDQDTPGIMMGDDDDASEDDGAGLLALLASPPRGHGHPSGGSNVLGSKHATLAKHRSQASQRVDLLLANKQPQRLRLAASRPRAAQAGQQLLPTATFRPALILFGTLAAVAGMLAALSLLKARKARGSGGARAAEEGALAGDTRAPLI